MSQLHTRKVTLSLPEDLVTYADSRAKAQGTTRSGFIGELLAELRSREQEELAREGYRFYAQEAEDFAAASSKAVAEAMRPPKGEAEVRPLARLDPGTMVDVDRALRFNLGLM